MSIFFWFFFSSFLKLGILSASEESVAEMRPGSQRLPDSVFSNEIKFLLIFLNFFPESSGEQPPRVENRTTQQLDGGGEGENVVEEEKEENPGNRDGRGSAKTRIRNLKGARRREGRALYRVTHTGRAAGVRGGWAGRWRP